MTYENPWLFNGEPFDDCSDYAGFVYLIIDNTTRKRYIGKKFFWTHRKVKGKRGKVTSESAWKKYYGSNDEIKQLVKEYGGSRFSRHILSLHSLVRDVSYEEVRLQYALRVLEEVDDEGSPTWYNASISGKHHAYLVRGISSRSVYSTLPLFIPAS